MIVMCCLVVFCCSWLLIICRCMWVGDCVICVRCCMFLMVSLLCYR